MLVIIPILLCPANLYQSLSEPGQMVFGAHDVEWQILRVHTIMDGR